MSRRCGAWLTAGHVDAVLALHVGIACWHNHEGASSPSEGSNLHGEVSAW